MKNVLGNLAELPYFILYKMDWNGEKYEKVPADMRGRPWTERGVEKQFVTYDEAVAALAPLPRSGASCYALGFWLREGCGYFLLDLDKSVVDGALTADASAVVAQFPGAFYELSSSQNGVHVIGRCQGDFSIYKNRTKKGSGVDYEFYTKDRGVAFGHHAVGNADLDCTAALLAVIPRYFDRRPKREEGGRRAEWRGPEDDDVLIERMLAAKKSAAVALGGKASLAQLWNGEVEKCSESDMALASHLAWWTGGDYERIERLLRRSGLYREKWERHRTYLQLTIDNAIATLTGCYQEPERDLSKLHAALGVVDNIPVQSTPSDMAARVTQLLSEVHEVGTFDQLVNQMIPRIAQAGVPPMLAERLVQAVNKKLEIFDSKMPVGRLRELLSPPIISRDMPSPDWCMRHCFVTKVDRFYDLQTGSELTQTGFYAKYAGLMPTKPNGRRENPVEWAFERWGMVVVDDWAYNPQKDHYFDWSGRTYVNRFVASSVPVVTPYTEAGVQAIQQFQQHLMLMCGGRQEVYMHLLNWMAHNVQFPGKKIRWSPIIKGVPGDGKSIIVDVLRAGLGDRNIGVTSKDTLSNTGGFTDWAVGVAVNAIEEMRLHGKSRYEIFETMKNFIDLMVVNINAKGRVGYSVPNTTNHIANTNYNDGLPVDLSDRRWMVVISPYSDAEDAARDRGLAGAHELPRYFAKIGEACRAVPGEFRTWLMSIDLQNFDPNGRAPWTDDKGRMIATAKDDVEDFIQDFLERGGRGISKEAFSSNRLTGLMKMSGMESEIPKTQALYHTLTRMGYEKLPKVVFWDGSSHRIWAKSHFKGEWEVIRKALDQSL